MRDAVDEGPHTAITTETGQRLPQGEPDFLQQVFLIRAFGRIDAHQPPDRRRIFGDDCIEVDTAQFSQKCSACRKDAVLEAVFTTTELLQISSG